MPKLVIIQQYEAADGTLHPTMTAAALHNLDKDFQTAYQNDPLSQAVGAAETYRWVARNRAAITALYSGLDKLP